LDKKVKFDYLNKGFHCGDISSLDICLQRPLIITCCQIDNSVRIWNYIKNTCVLAIGFVDEKVHKNLYDPNENTKTVLAASFHPSGYYLCISFVQSLKFFHLLHKELR